MPEGVALRLLLDGFLEFRGEIYPRLVRQTE